MTQDDTKYLVPTGDGKSQISIELESIYKAELRLQDVAIVNQHTAPELLSSFNSIWLLLNKSVTQLTLHKNIADNCHENAIADAKLACTEEALKKLGHNKGSADLRAAWVQKNPEVQKTKDRLDEISFILDTLRGKMQAFFNAYNSVKKLVNNNSLPLQHYGDGNRPQVFAAPPAAPKHPEVDPQSQDPELEPLPQGFKGR